MGRCTQASGGTCTGAAPATAAGEAPKRTRTIRKLVQGTNINSKTLLATDYLNHFNEIVMLLELVPTMPEMLEEALAWTPKSYAQHFRDSCFADKNLAVLAYENAPTRYRAPFDETVARLDRAVVGALQRLRAAGGDAGLLEAHAQAASRTLQRLIERASAIINGRDGTADRRLIDEIIEDRGGNGTPASD